MSVPKDESNWAWITHILALLFSVVCLGLVTYCIVGIQNLDMAKVTMGFASALLGVILGFYFNREQLTKESKQKDYYSTQADVINSEFIRLEALLESVRSAIEEEPEEE